MPNNKIYDLKERTENFGVAVVVFAKTIPKNIVTVPLISQFVRAGTSVGANYSEADDAESRDDFKHKIRESQELNLIFNAIVNSTKRNSVNRTPVAGLNKRSL